MRTEWGRRLLRVVVIVLSLVVGGLLVRLLLADVSRRAEQRDCAHVLGTIERQHEARVAHGLAAAAAELADGRRDLAVQRLDVMPMAERGWLWRHLQYRARPDWLHIGLEPQTSAPVLSCSPDGTMLAARRATGRVGVWSLADGSLLHDLPISGSWPRAIAFSASGELVIAGRKELMVYTLATGALRHRWPASLRGMCLIDADRLIGISGRELRCLAVADGRELWKQRVRCEHVRLLGVDDGAVLLAQHEEVLAVPVDGSGKARREHRRKDAVWLATCRIDGRPRFLGVFDGETCGLSGSGGGSAAIAVPVAQQDGACSPDGERFAVCGWRRWELRLCDSGGKEQAMVIATPSIPVALTFTPDGQRLVVGMREQIAVFDLARLPGPTSRIGMSGAAGDALVTLKEPGGSGLLSGHADGSLQVHYPGMARPCYRVDCGDAAVEALLWDGDDLVVHLVDGSEQRLTTGQGGQHER